MYLELSEGFYPGEAVSYLLVIYKTKVEGIKMSIYQKKKNRLSVNKKHNKNRKKTRRKKTKVKSYLNTCSPAPTSFFLSLPVSSAFDTSAPM